MIGNQAVLNLIQRRTKERDALSTTAVFPHFEHTSARIAAHPQAGALQAKLAVSKAENGYEQAADRAAEQVMRMPEPQIQLTEDQARDQGLQAKPTGGSAGGLTEALPGVGDVLRSAGQPLDATTRAFMEPRVFTRRPRGSDKRRPRDPARPPF